MTALTVSATPPPPSPPRLRVRPVPVAEPRPALRVVPDPEPRPPAGQGVLVFDGADRPDEPPAAAPHRVPPPAAAWARQFVQAALEAACGRRPVSQLLRWTAEDVYAMLTRRAALAARLDRSASAGTASCLVRSVRLCRPRDGVVEASALAVDRGRYRAVALRLEDADGRWRVTALEIG